MKTALAFALLIASVSSYDLPTNQKNGYEVLAEKLGDLDKDGIPEKVIVYDTPETTDEGTVREIQVLKQQGKEWLIWTKSKNAVLKSKEGGMMGNPFEGVEISNGVLIIHHSGGSSWKWSKQDKYRFQNNEFQLIGFTGNYGKPCEDWEHVDFNVSTGKVVYKKEYESCDKDQKVYKTENDTFYHKGLSINLNNRNVEEIKLVSPKYKAEVYL